MFKRIYDQQTIEAGIEPQPRSSRAEMEAAIAEVTEKAGGEFPSGNFNMPIEGMQIMELRFPSMWDLQSLREYMDNEILNELRLIHKELTEIRTIIEEPPAFIVTIETAEEVNIKSRSGGWLAGDAPCQCIPMPRPDWIEAFERAESACERAFQTTEEIGFGAYDPKP
jgi:hypothetical protein